MGAGELREGASVRVRLGVGCPDAPEIDISGWGGRVVDDDGELVRIAWDSLSLQQLPAWYIAASDDEGYDWQEMVLERGEVEPAPARDTPEDTRRVQDQLYHRQIWFSLELSGLRGMADERVFQRGLDYFRAGLVRELVFIRGGFRARVEGSCRSTVTIEGLPGEEKLSCDCPYSGRGACEHAVAVMLAVSARGEELVDEGRARMATSSAIAVELHQALLQARHPGSFFATGIEVTPLPEVRVEGVGLLSFPLLPEQAGSLLRVAEPAPHGRGPETLVDPAVRQAWQLSPGRFSVGGAPWAATLGTVVRKTAAALGVSGDVTAELYKLVLYQPGGFFLEHRDTEKAPGMFGTLVIALPSPHSGGELVVRHVDQEVSLPLSAGSPSQVSYAAFYADCLHQLRPVTEGMRLVLVYNLIRRGPGARPAPPDHRAVISEVTALLQRWSAELEDVEEETEPESEGGGHQGPPGKLVYVLEHHYTAAEVCFSALKRADAAAATVLTEAARAADIDLHLALLSIDESGAAEPQYYGRYDDDWGDEEDDFEVVEVIEHSQTLTGWRAPGDLPVSLGEIPFEDHELSPPGALEGVAPDRQRYLESSGNAGASYERAWRRAALVLWPLDRSLQVVAGAGLAASLPYLEQLIERWQGADAAPDTSGRERAVELAQAVIDRWRGAAGPTRARALSALVRTGEPGLVVQLVSRALVHGGYDGSEEGALVDALRLLSPAVAGVLLRQLVERHGHFQFKPCALLLARVSALPGQGAALSLQAAEALLAELPGAAGEPKAYNDWRRPSAPDADFVRALALTCWQIGDGSLSGRALDIVLSKPSLYPLDSAVLPATLALSERAGVGLWPGYRRLEAACVAHLEARTALPLEAPGDWVRASSSGCGCQHCKELQVFMADPGRRQWHFRARQELRSHLEHQIQRQRCDLDLTTERRGSPHTLVCTKNQASYERRVRQRRDDLAALAQLRAASGGEPVQGV